MPSGMLSHFTASVEHPPGDSQVFSGESFISFGSLQHGADNVILEIT